MHSTHSSAIPEVIILAGGQGTRLRDAVPELPKCLAPVAGQPFLAHVIRYLVTRGIQRFIFSLGYKHEQIESFLIEQYPNLSYELAIEDHPLGTGGAIRFAAMKVQGEHSIVVNGDTLFDVDLAALSGFHLLQQSSCTLCLKPMHDFSRYGVVELNENGFVASFREKQYYTEGLINGGVYALDTRHFLATTEAGKFSFEKDWLETTDGNRKIMGLVQDNYFIDIGIPEDFRRAQDELKKTPPDLSLVDQSWTVFIDRDGVVNDEKKDEYILNWKEFHIYDDVRKAFSIFNGRFGLILMATNQRGIGKGLMTVADLEAIHAYMKSEIEQSGGRIDHIYYCTAVDPRHPDRKPNPGMAWQAQENFPAITFSKSIMVGNKLSDMRFGRNAGMYTIYIKRTHPAQPLPDPDIDLAFDTLGDFAKALG